MASQHLRCRDPHRLWMLMQQRDDIARGPGTICSGKCLPWTTSPWRACAKVCSLLCGTGPLVPEYLARAEMLLVIQRGRGNDHVIGSSNYSHAVTAHRFGVVCEVDRLVRHTQRCASEKNDDYVGKQANQSRHLPVHCIRCVCFRRIFGER